MPGRATPLINDQIYHVFNRGINRQPTFIIKKDHTRAKLAIYFYRFAKPPLKLSRYLTLDDNRKEVVDKILRQSPKLVDIISYCLMPNHFHFLLRQTSDKGISTFIGNFQNSYTRYFNIKHDRDGSIFLDQFKAVRIETEEQLLHVSRYIHLNPLTGYVVKTKEELEAYPWSSFLDFLEKNDEVIEINSILDLISQNIKEYKKFIFDQASYQRELKDIGYLLIENP